MPQSKTMKRAAMGAMAAVTASFTFGASAAEAKGKGATPASYGAMAKSDPMAVMHMIDSGDKGYVTREEFIKFQESLFRKMDTNADGRVTEKEWWPDRSNEGGG